ncbi:putative protease Do-like 14 [Tripterygium wilfordii]|uniref:putative protease Do-like 14 n=1 Tax=Tripterygium wilfordii TaxID=458696 RepID=UPI0018F80502|nr:putative protease Do-like 14 [Tripterygium wilfordii]
MNQFLRKSSSHLIRNSIVSLGALGSGLLYANSDSNPRTRITVSINAPFHESLSLLPWKLSENVRPRSLFLSAEQGQFGNLPLFSSRVSSASSEDIMKEAPDGEGDDAKPFVGRRVVRPWLGLKMVDLNELIIVQLKERDATFPNVSEGVLVPMVAPDSPADRAGFHLGDVVIEFDGKPIKSIKEIVEIMEDRIGVPLKVIVIRANDNAVTLTVVPEEANPEV